MGWQRSLLGYQPSRHNLTNILRMVSSSSAGNLQLTNRLAGKVAVVTASTEGIGFSIAQRLAQEGANVVVSSRKESKVQSALADLERQGLKNVIGLSCHVAKSSDREKLIQKVLQRFGGIDILVSNAATNPVFGAILDCTEEAWDKIFETNLKASFMLTKEIVPHIKKRGGGSVIYISSIMGVQPTTALGAYAVSKTALLGLTKAVAAQVASDNIRVNCVAPGIIKTKFSKVFHEEGELRDMILQQVPQGRIAEPSEIAGVVSFLCSSDASYITGETIVAAGGMMSRL